MSSLSDIRDSFFQECEDLLDALSDGLRRMAGDSCEMETVHAVFRAVHSIKGGAGAFSLTDLVTFSHRFETVLDHLRSSRLAVSPAVMHVFHRAGDHLSDLVAAARDASEPDHAQTARLLEELDALIGGTPVEEDPAEIAFQPLALGIGPLPGLADLGPATPAGTRYAIRFTPMAELYASGNDPALLLRALAKLGTLEVELRSDDVPPLSELDWQGSYVGWSLTLVTGASESDIGAVFEFVEDMCDLSIQREDDGAAPDLPDLLSLVAGRNGGAAPPGEARRLHLSPPVTHAPAALAAPRAEQPAAEPVASEGQRAPVTIRVNLDRVDRLINLVGEMVIKEAMLSQVIDQADLPPGNDVSGGLDGIKQLAGEIQESVMAIRAQPLKPVFQRMHRIVREAADATGKEVRLVSLGEQTEVDKTVIERLVDPLTHMIRNSVDHGLEDGATRIARGKPAEGTVTLSAAHRSGRVIIDVSDDGGGINRAKVRKVAESKGLIPEGAPMTASEIDNLLFLPGFSSKDEVSSLSGRGVGLDVVRREIQALGGRVMISSTEGEGTTFSIALPLTLAVLEGMLIALEGQTLVIPITAIQETLRPSSVLVHPLGRSGRVVSSRGELIPIIDLGHALDLRPMPEDLDKRVLIIVETDTKRRAALLVDKIFDQRQVVIKSLEDNYGRVAGIAAATILGNGRIALIIDPEEIVHTAAGDPVHLAAGTAEI